MANVISGNTASVDSVGALDIENDEGLGMVYVTLASTGASASVTLKDKGSGGGPLDKVILNVKDADDSEHFDWSKHPMIFSNGIEVTAIVSCTATIVFTRGRKV